MAEKRKVLFICLGNICRSPIAEAVFIHDLEKKGIRDDWEVDSAAIGAWHVGKSPDHRARSIMKKHNIPLTSKARQIRESDFNHYDIIFGMDHENMTDLEQMAPRGSKASLELFGSYDPNKELIIRDPYYDDGDKGFEKCYEQCVQCSKGYLESLGIQ